MNWRWSVALLLMASMFAQAEISDGAAHTFMCLGKSLMPAWGFHRAGEEYDGTRPLDQSSAWNPTPNRRTLTWVADFPAPGEYHVWIRRYGAYGQFEISVNEVAIAPGREGPGGGRYVWHHAGTTQIPRAGLHHVDIAFDNGFLDAILLTTDARFVPADENLPQPVSDPKVDLPREYRDDSSLANERGFAAGAVTLYEMHQYDWLPRQHDLIDELRMWGAAEQYVAGTFAVRALKAAEEFRATLGEIAGPGGAKIGANELDVRVVHVRHRRMYGTNTDGSRFMPQLLLRDDRGGVPPKGHQGNFGGTSCVTSIPAHQSRQFWITIHVPAGSPPGMYEGELRLSVAGDAARQLALPLRLEVLDVNLRSVDGYFGIYHMHQPLDPNQSNYGPNNYVTPRRYRAELKDMVRHGLNTTTIYQGVGQLEYLKEAGMTRTPCLMTFPRGREAQELAAAREAGFDGLHYYGYDEPNGERIELCRREAISRHERGLTMMTAINSRVAFEAMWDVVDHPVYAMNVFGDPRSSSMEKVKSKGFTPISYWTVGPNWPMQTRAWAGPYNEACGFVGAMPWAYVDYPDNRQYEGDDPHGVAFPDEFGDPIPTLAWEAYRDGIDDLRYLQALRRAIAAAEGKSQLQPALDAAKQLLAQHTQLRQTASWMFMYLLAEGQLDAERRAMADATVQILDTLRGKP